ncbi:MAG TPA: hypothetical protein VM097_07145 [Mycobacteriales bacterium]|nr:hypothetical protein [Mycobacteriales bacterium]
MTRRQWTGLAGILFGALMVIGVTTSGTTPDTGTGAVERYTKYWADGGHQDRAALGSILLTYACVLLALFSAALGSLLSRTEDGGLRSVVLSTGTAAAATLAAGAALLNGVGIAAAESSGYAPDGSQALLVEAIGYYTAATAMMMAGAMAVAFSLANRRARLVPQWTTVLSGLLGLVALGSIFVAWIGFMVLPVWSVVIGVCLLVRRQSEDPAPA